MILTEAYLKTLARNLVKIGQAKTEDEKQKHRKNALRLCNRILKKRWLQLGKRRFWEQIQFELKKPDPKFSKWEFVRILGNDALTETDFDHLMNDYKAKADVLSLPYWDAQFHYQVMNLAKNFRSFKKK